SAGGEGGRVETALERRRRLVGRERELRARRPPEAGRPRRDRGLGRDVVELEGPDVAGRALGAMEEALVSRRAPGSRVEGGAGLRDGHRLAGPAVVVDGTRGGVGGRV